ncbi:MAG: hypothetical protein GY748_21265 [Planctomycetaceae bacterium]|nr:hypothetical protein [Planctomycetaceae bacterium]
MKSKSTIRYREHPPDSDTVTAYDRQCFQLYIMLIDADASGTKWQETYREAFSLEVGEDHKRAQWMMAAGYTQLL